MVDFFARLFDVSGFPPRWNCGRWTAGHGWLHIVSDLGIWSAYLAIPMVLVFFFVRRKDLPFRKIFLLFGAFILACGMTHLMEAIIFWWPAYRLAGVVKLFTALVSWATVLSLFQVVPRALNMRSLEELEREIAARTRAEAELQRVNAELELRVHQRTEDLILAADALRDERELLRTTLRSIGDGVIVTDTQGAVTFLNGVAEKLTGWSSEASKGLPLESVFHIIHEQFAEPVDNPALRALRDGAIVGLANHTVLLAKDGTGRPIDDSAAPIRGEDGIVRGAVLVFRDISERKQAENALRESERREKERAAELETVLRATPTPIWISHDPECRQVTGNPASYRMLQVEEGSNVSATSPTSAPRRFKEHRNGVPLPPDELPLQVAASQGVDVVHAELSVVFEDGLVRHLYGNASPIRDQDGSVRGAVAAFMDITQLKNTEHALKEADQRKDEFLATLAHELRNPLAPIRNSLEIMKRAGGNPELVAMARSTMERQLGQMVRLVDDLIDVSRISRNRLELRLEKVELAPTVHHVLEACRPLVDSAHHELIVALPSEPVYLNADSVRLAQIFGNLLTNSCKYTEPGGVIWLTAERQEGELIVRIRDTGIGIPPEMLPKVFEMFTQLDRSLERSQSGLGIGLTLVKRLAEMHGGSVTAFSEGRGKGSEFVVRLPILTEPMTVQTALDETRKAAPSVSRRILVVDDNRDSAGTLAMWLRMIGNDVALAHDGLEAVEQAKSYRPDVILLDIGMPKLNGYAACRAIREQASGKPLFILAVTGWGQEEDRRKSKEAGFDGHLVKPIDHEVLAKILSDLEAS